MDEPLFCPDCHELHAEPAEATLGHLVRCLACALALEAALAAVPAQGRPSVFAVRAALRPAA